MPIIKRNPYRTLGLLSNSTERELQKQISIIKRYSEIGKYKAFDYDFDFIGDLARQTDDIRLAVSQIEQAYSKLLYSIFWFVKNSQFDEIAINCLKDKNIEKAIEIWNKTLRGGISSRNYSSYHNLSTLYLALCITDGQLAVQYLKDGIELKGELIHSDCMIHFSELVTRGGAVSDPMGTSKKFVDEMVGMISPYFDSIPGIMRKHFITLFDSYPSEIQKYVSNVFTEAPVLSIENAIEKTKVKRKDSPYDAEEHGEDLFISTKRDVVLLKSLLGEQDAQLQMIINKLANEILQCAIDFFNEFRTDDSELDPGEAAIRVVKFANSLGATGQTENRVYETTEVIQDWVNDAPERERLEVIAEDVAFVASELQQLERRFASIQNARTLVMACKPKLVNIRSEVGSNDEFYLQMSDAVVNNALGMLIEVVNKEQENIEGLSSILAFETTASSAVSVINMLTGLDMTEEVRDRLRLNKKTIQGLLSQVKQISNRVPSSANSSSGACYIATMAYGDYNHPQVLRLRKYRDEILSTNLPGRLFVKFYYATSPYLVRTLKNRTNINRILRQILDRFVKRIK